MYFTKSAILATNFAQNYDILPIFLKYRRIPADIPYVEAIVANIGNIGIDFFSKLGCLHFSNIFPIVIFHCRYFLFKAFISVIIVLHYKYFDHKSII